VSKADFPERAYTWLLERKTRQSARPTDPAFPGINGQTLSSVSLYIVVRDTLRKIGYQGVHVGSGVLRNTWCQRQILAGVDSQVIQRCMGLRTAKTVGRINEQVESPTIAGAAECLSQAEDAALQNYLLKEAPTPSWQCLRNRAMLLFILETAVTDLEARSARIQQFCFDEMVSVFRSGASIASGTELVPLSELCAQAIRTWLLERKTLLFARPTDLVFAKISGQMLSSLSLYKFVRDALRDIGYEGPHAGAGVLRNTWCQRQILAGVDSQVILRRMGRGSASTVRRLNRRSPRVVKISDT
jgi:site-specific recombinase XerD